MFYLLNKIYFEDTPRDSLGSLLGSMNPELFAGEEPADPACWIYWEQILKIRQVTETISNGKLLMIIDSFLAFYQDEFGYDLKNIRTNIQNILPEDQQVIECINKAIVK